MNGPPPRREREADPGAEIEQPGKQQRIGDAEEQLCNRRARAKEECRA
jgi:hypothetical protein